MTASWIVIVQQITTTVEDWRTDYHWDGERHASPREAFDSGWRTLGHDDFNIGRLDGNHLAWFGWTDGDQVKELDDFDLAEISRHLCLPVSDPLPGGIHVGRSWSGTRLEDACPCPKEPCGLVDTSKTDPSCPEHPEVRAKTIRRSHPATECPGAGDQP